MQKPAFTISMKFVLVLWSTIEILTIESPPSNLEALWWPVIYLMGGPANLDTRAGVGCSKSNHDSLFWASKSRNPSRFRFTGPFCGEIAFFCRCPNTGILNSGCLNTGIQSRTTIWVSIWLAAKLVLPPSSYDFCTSAAARTIGCFLT